MFRNIIISLQLLFFVANAQTVFSDSFNDFGFDSTRSGVVGHYSRHYGLFTKDHASNNTTTANNSAGDSVLSNNKYYNGGSAVFFSTSGSEYFSIADASADAFEFTSAFSMFFEWRYNGSQIFVTKMGSAGNLPGWQFKYEHTTNNIQLFTSDNVGLGWTASDAISVEDNAFHVIGLTFDNGTIVYYLDGDTVSTNTTVNIPVANTGDFRIGRTQASTYSNAYLSSAIFFNRVVPQNEAEQFGKIAVRWRSLQGNVSGGNGNWWQTAWADTLTVPLPNAILGNNQEWVLTSSNIDDVTAWIGSRSSAKSVKKSITGGVSFVSNTTYFGDGFSLEGDSLVVVFPADTASIDNIVFKKAQHHLKSPANRGWLGW